MDLANIAHDTVSWNVLYTNFSQTSHIVFCLSLSFKNHLILVHRKRKFVICLSSTWKLPSKHYIFAQNLYFRKWNGNSGPKTYEHAASWSPIQCNCCPSRDVNPFLTKSYNLWVKVLPNAMPKSDGLIIFMLVRMWAEQPRLARTHLTLTSSCESICPRERRLKARCRRRKTSIIIVLKST